MLKLNAEIDLCGFIGWMMDACIDAVSKQSGWYREGRLWG